MFLLPQDSISLSLSLFALGFSPSPSLPSPRHVTVPPSCANTAHDGAHAHAHSPQPALQANGEPDYADVSKTENTRVSYPIYHIDNYEPTGMGGHPNSVIFLTCDAFGVLPPVSRLSAGQARDALSTCACVDLFFCAFFCACFCLVWILLAAWGHSNMRVGWPPRGTALWLGRENSEKEKRALVVCRSGRWLSSKT